MRRLDRAEALARLAAGVRTGKLATVAADGAPTVVPIWFAVDEEELVFTTWHESAKARNLRRDPRAALVVDDETFPFGFVLVRGPVTIEESAPDMLAWSTRIAARYVPAGRESEFGERNAVAGEWLCRLRAERILAQDEIAV